MRRLIPSIPLLAVLLSILLHGAVLVPAIGLLDQVPVDRLDPPVEGMVELLPVEVAGADAVTPSETAHEPPMDASATAAAAEPEPEEPPPERVEMAAMPPPVAAVRPPAAAPSAEQGLTLQLQGTDSASNAVVSGANLLPASIDDRSRNRPPVYPAEAARRRETGTVIVLIRVSSLGTTEGAEVITSSGHRSLDRAAVEAVMAWRFRPAIQDGRAVPFEMPMRFVFAMR